VRTSKSFGDLGTSKGSHGERSEPWAFQLETSPRLAALTVPTKTADVRMKVKRKNSRSSLKWFALASLAISWQSLLQFTCSFLLLALPAFGQYGRSQGGVSQTGLPKPLINVGIDQHLNEPLPLNLMFKDENEKDVRLGDYFGTKPVVLALVYYECPMLCNELLNGLVSSLRVLPFDAGKEFSVVAVSFNPLEEPSLAHDVKSAYLKRYGHRGDSSSWHFLTGKPLSIDILTRSVGFRYTYDAETRQYAHASGIMLVTPLGRLSRYFYGIEFAPRDLRLGLVEASTNKIGSLTDQVLLFCFHYDPARGKYGFIIMNVIRACGLLFVLIVGTFVLVMLRRDHLSRIEDRGLRIESRG
jgi:protein SCO1